LLTVDRHAVPTLWDVANPARPRKLATIPTISLDSTFSPDGELLVTTDVSPRPPDPAVNLPAGWSVDATSRIWDISDTGRPRQLALLPDSFVAVTAFADARRTIATVSMGNLPAATLGSPSLQATLMLWDITTPARPRLASRVAMASGVQPLGATFTRDDRILYMSDSAGELTVWNVDDIASPRKLSAIAESHDLLTGVVSSPDDSMLVAGDTGGKLTVWDISNSPYPKQFIRTESAGLSFGQVIFAADNNAFRTLAYHAEPGKASLLQWQLDARRSADTLCGDARSHISKSDWNKYLVDTPYRQVCP
jgi:WD40 repeat protein